MENDIATIKRIGFFTNSAVKCLLFCFVLMTVISKQHGWTLCDSFTMVESKNLNQETPLKISTAIQPHNKLSASFSSPENPLVVIPCSECMKIIYHYIGQCAQDEGLLKPIISLREFCEASSLQDASFTDQDFLYCIRLGEHLSKKTGSNFATMHTQNHLLGSCSTFQHMCEKYGGDWTCYSGFCDKVANCIDCPYIMLQKTATQPLRAEVCGDRGVCRLGSTQSKNGYCECDSSYRGLSCNVLDHETS